MSEALPASVGVEAASRSATTTTSAPRAARPPAHHVQRLRPSRVNRSRSTREPAGREVARHGAGGGAVTPAAGACGWGSRRRSPSARVAASRPSNRHVGGQPLRQRAGTILEREHRQHSRQQGGHERRPVDAQLDQGAGITIAATYNLEGDGPCTTDPPCGRRAAVQKLLTYPLRKEGYEVVPALDGQEALERCGRPDFDLVVLDVMLPKLDGFDVCRQIRARSARADHHAHRQGRGDRQGARPRARGGRLHHQALLRARVPQPGEGRAPAGRDHRGGGAASRTPISRGRGRRRLREAPGDVRDEASSSPTWSSRSSPRWPAPPGRVLSRTLLLEQRVGRRLLPRSRAPSTCTSAT